MAYPLGQSCCDLLLEGMKWQAGTKNSLKEPGVTPGVRVISAASRITEQQPNLPWTYSGPGLCHGPTEEGSWWAWMQ